MKKSLISSTILLFLSLGCYAQIAYYDAIELKKYVNLTAPAKTFYNDPATVQIVTDIAKKYYPNIPDTSNWDNVKSTITILNAENPDYNPFLAPYFNVIPALGVVGIQSRSILNSVASLPLTSFADGLSKFLIKRGKAELLISVINQLKDDKKYPEFKVLFPNTRLLLDNFEAGGYSNVINTVREAFDRDLQQLLGNIAQLTTLNSPGIYDNKAAERVKAIKAFIDSDSGRLLISGMQISNGLIIGQKIPDIIHTIAGNGYLGDIPGASADATSAIKLFDIISYSIRSNTPGSDYISVAELTTLRADPVLLNLYLGLLYQQLHDEKIVVSGIDVAVFLNTNRTAFDTFTTNLITHAVPLNAAIINLVEARKNSEKNLTPYLNRIFQTADQFFKSSTQISSINARFKFPDKLQNALQLTSSSFDIIHDLTLKNYSAAVISTLLFMSANIKSPDIKKFQEFFVKYGSFAANIVQAQNSADAEAAIEAIALPAGSYSIKQTSAWNISLNAYVGYGIDRKYAKGAYAPVGISNSWAFGKNKGAFTLFASAIDVGSLVSYRLTNGNTDELKQEVRLESIISPSAQAIIALPGLPIALAAGWRRTPKLFYSDNTQFEVKSPKNVFNISFLIDIPLITLHNTPR